nr:MAG TPA: hypothetical protein [Caudoviricetes sp.]
MIECIIQLSLRSSQIILLSLLLQKLLTVAFGKFLSCTLSLFCNLKTNRLPLGFFLQVPLNYF